MSDHKPKLTIPELLSIEAKALTDHAARLAHLSDRAAASARDLTKTDQDREKLWMASAAFRAVGWSLVSLHNLLSDAKMSIEKAS